MRRKTIASEFDACKVAGVNDLAIYCLYCNSVTDYLIRKEKLILDTDHLVLLGQLTLERL